MNRYNDRSHLQPAADDRTSSVDRDQARELILDHSSRPSNFGRLVNASSNGVAANPICGDRFSVFISLADQPTDRLTDRRIAEIKFTGAGCAISMASASMMTEAVKGIRLSETKFITINFFELFLGDDVALVDRDALGDLMFLSGVRKFPLRVRCAMLAWEALQLAVEAAESTETKVAK